MIATRFDQRIPFYLIILLSISYVLSIFALQLFGGLLAILWLLEKNSKKKKAIDGFIIFVCIFGVARLLSIAFSEYPAASITALYKEALFYFSVFSLGFYLKVLDNRKKRLIIYSFVIGATLNSIIGLIQFNFGIVERAQSLSSGYTVFSNYLVVVLGAAISSFGFDEVKKKYSYLNIIFTGLILAGIITSLGRADTAVAVIILFISIIIRMINFKQLMLIIIIAAGLSYLSFKSNTTVVSERIEAPVYLSDRDIIYKGAREIIWEHPVFGFGPRTFKNIFPIRNEFADKKIGGWHNHILQMYFESGIIGLTAYLVLMFFVFKSAYKFLKNKYEDESKFIVKGILLAATALFLSAFFSGFIDSPILSIEFAFLVSLLSSEIYKKNKI